MNEHKDRYIGSWYTWSPYERYLILSDNSRSRLTHNYESFLRFREVREILNKISKSSLNTYEYNNEMHTKPFSSEVAAYTLNQIDAGIWSNNIKTIIMCHKIAGVYVPFDPDEFNGNASQEKSHKPDIPRRSNSKSKPKADKTSKTWKQDERKLIWDFVIDNQELSDTQIVQWMFDKNSVVTEKQVNVCRRYIEYGLGIREFYIYNLSWTEVKLNKVLHQIPIVERIDKK